MDFSSSTFGKIDTTAVLQYNITSGSLFLNWKLLINQNWYVEFFSSIFEFNLLSFHTASNWYWIYLSFFYYSYCKLLSASICIFFSFYLASNTKYIWILFNIIFLNFPWCLQSSGNRNHLNHDQESLLMGKTAHLRNKNNAIARTQSV